MSRPAERLLEVQLLEGDLEGSDPPRRGARADRRPAAARAPRRVWWAAVGLVALAAAGTAVAGRVREAGLDDRLADVAGLSASLDRPLVEAWRVPGSGVLGVVGDTVVVRSAAGAGVLGVDPATGTVRWARDGSCEQVPVEPASVDPTAVDRTAVDPAAVEPTPAGGTGSPDHLVNRPDDLVVCVEQLSTGGADGGHVLPLAAHVVDPATGDVLRRIDLGPRTSYATVGSDVVTLGVAEDGPGTLTLDAATGRRVPDFPPRDPEREATWGRLRLADGATAVSRPDPARSAETVVREADGSRRVTVPGLLVLPSPDDGSAPDRLFVVRGDGPAGPLQVAGVDPATGATRWTVTTPTGRAAVVQGLLLLRDDGGVTALDARTGTLRWASTGDDAPRSGGSLVTDGRRVLIVEGVPRNPTLVARDVVSGAVVWSRPHPGEGAAPAVLPDGTVVAVGSGELVALRPPGG